MSKLFLNKKVFRIILIIVISFLILFSLNNFVNKSCPCNNQIQDDLEESIPAKIKLGNGNSESEQIQFIAQFDSADLLRLWNAKKHSKDNAISQKGLPPMDEPATVSIHRHNPELCKSVSNLTWIFAITSKAERFEHRMLLRETWANIHLFKKSETFRVIFLIGKSNDANVQKGLEEEFNVYTDLVQGDFLDEANTNTNKVILGLRWISEYCTNAKIMLKANDLSFINIFELFRLLNLFQIHFISSILPDIDISDLNKKVIELSLTENNNNYAVPDFNLDRTIACPLWAEDTMPILRETTQCGSYCVPDRYFPGKEYFPKYCAGVAVTISIDIVRQLYNSVSKTPFFFIEDVYLTGLLLPKAIENSNDRDQSHVKMFDIQSGFTQNEIELRGEYIGGEIKESTGNVDNTIKDANKGGGNRNGDMQYFMSTIQNAPFFRELWKGVINNLKPVWFKQLSDSAIAKFA